MGSDGIRMALGSLAKRGYVEMRKEGQKSLYKHRNTYIASTVESFGGVSDD
jgi:hypothetical protein